ncbi:phospholipid/cholesterol/gamma-HCH transport system ATP-binding protein [Roseivirga pacifica]|uniref:Phospholipid/cholesterol/gamma-HCH transport system ATP-binding protein n=1 Tax=Roseivirga pacifica TaxID=1267423 RepID=A0A1I0RFA8_9BACT|nr:ATP-binding cassette domain-containing protein [Roseivirga pacifica]MCO6357575.1 ATP-binding cassette domain-containing protein [Roseivirga pacifica]MCO6365828.1 ATP-binding cassette domain-containing protein [Roseivirga pacifica]MCO6371157.1 ATP-binding cassette domain-containing protein [Roseivirga pacifica]MCO6375672.1 ATP-binding cassette domain-containing protein [Roseivirga pacifica]MCO6378535.1 ATP-binding cassette domain-containing protein [Roseivirga pacifica]
MIELKNVSKSFGDKQVLNGIDATFEKGKTNLIIGASGSGKSVLLKNIVGLFKPDEGEILYDNRNLVTADRDLKTDIRREIGMLFQGGALFDSMNVEQNVKFPLDVLTKMPEDEKLDRVNEVLARVKLENTNTKMPSEISGGMQKRVGIARAIVNNSKYLFCDEPNSGLDPRTSIKIDQLLAEITEEYQITTVIVTHDMNSVMEIGEYIIFICNTRKLWEGNNEGIAHSGIEELDDFVFANKMMRKFRGMV